MNVIKGCKYNKPVSKMDNIVRRFKLYNGFCTAVTSAVSQVFFSNPQLFIFSPAIFDDRYKYLFPQVLNKSYTVGLGTSLTATNNTLKYFSCISAKFDEGILFCCH